MPERTDSERDLRAADAPADPQVSGSRPDDPRVAGSPAAVADAEFALLLTHDVDRPYKSVQSIYHAVQRRDLGQLKGLAPGVNPWWQFEDVMELEDSLGVRSSFYFLREPHLLTRDALDWFDPFYWIEEFGRYDVETPEILDVLDRLREGGWEVGIHGSYDAYDDPDRLRLEKDLLEHALGDEVAGGRQHNLNHTPDTWEHYRAIGLNYDASVGSADEYGFRYGYRPFRPFGDAFVVFPLTLMEATLPDPGETFAEAWAVCEDLLEEAAREEAVMSVLWHPRLFTQADFPGYQRVYRRLVERALEMGAWVGPPGDYYELLDHPGGEGVSPAASDSGGPADATGADESGSTAAKNRHKSHLRAEQAEDNKVTTPANTESTG